MSLPPFVNVQSVHTYGKNEMNNDESYSHKVLKILHLLWNFSWNQFIMLYYSLVFSTRVSFCNIHTVPNLDRIILFAFTKYLSHWGNYVDKDFAFDFTEKHCQMAPIVRLNEVVSSHFKSVGENRLQVSR